MPGVGRPDRGVDEMFRNRHETAARRLVESAVRAAGGFPTQGGGLRALASSPGARDGLGVA